MGNILHVFANSDPSGSEEFQLIYKLSLNAKIKNWSHRVAIPQSLYNTFVISQGSANFMLSIPELTIPQIYGPWPTPLLGRIGPKTLESFLTSFVARVQENCISIVHLHGIDGDLNPLLLAFKIARVPVVLQIHNLKEHNLHQIGHFPPRIIAAIVLGTTTAPNFRPEVPLFRVSEEEMNSNLIEMELDSIYRTFEKQE